MSVTEINETLIKISKQYNALFWMYSRAVCHSWVLKLILVNHYVKYLLSFLDMGENTRRILVDNSNGNWTTCYNFMKELIIDNRVDEAKKSDWGRLFAKMASVFDFSI